MASVYSVQLAAQTAYSGTLDVLVPSGFKLVLRDVDVMFYGAGGGAEFVLYGNIGNRLWFVDAPADTAVFAQWRGRQVFEPGQMFQLQASPTSGSHVDFMASGYKLSLP